jgi:alcohol dehydrogenase
MHGRLDTDRVLPSYRSFAHTNDEFRTAFDLAPKVDLGWTDSFPLEQGALIFTELMGGRTDIHKAVLRP